jgi:hypothetical protein
MLIGYIISEFLAVCMCVWFFVGVRVCVCVCVCVSGQVDVNAADMIQL